MTSRPMTAQRRESATVHPFPSPSMVAIVLGAQWGDEVSKDELFSYAKMLIRGKANSSIY